MITTRPFGHPKARKFLNGNHIPVQAVKLQGDTLQESAMATLIALAWEGKGPLAKALKTEATALVEKFTKSNPEFKFSKFGRDRSKSSEDTKQAKPAKQAKASKATSKKTAKPAKKKAQKSQELEPALA
jgi:hypothetical protein